MSSPASRKEQPTAQSGRPPSSSAARGRGRGRGSSPILQLQVSPGSKTSMEPAMNTRPPTTVPPTEQLSVDLQTESNPSQTLADSGTLQPQVQVPPAVRVFDLPKPDPVVKRGRGRRSLTSDEIRLLNVSPGKKTDHTIGEPMEAIFVPKQSSSATSETQQPVGFISTQQGLTTSLSVESAEQAPRLPTHLTVTADQQFEPDTMTNAVSFSQVSEGTPSTSASSVSNSEEHTIVLQISNLPAEALACDISAYFEGQGEDVDVTSTNLLPGGKACVKVVGLTTEELAVLQKKRHRIKKQPIQVTLSTTTYDSDDSLHHELEAESQPMDTIIVTNLPSNYDEEYLLMFFENPSKSNGSPDSVESCTIVAPGNAEIKFKSPEFAAKVMEKERHTLKKQDLHLQYKITYVSNEDEDMQLEMPKLLLCKLPEVDSDHLNLFVSNRLGMDEEDFSVQRNGDAAVVTFATGVEYTCEELKLMIEKLKRKPLKGVTVDAQLYKASNAIRMSNISEHYDQEFLELYFQTAKLGGGEETEIKMLGKGEAIVTFQDPQVITRVLSIKHTKFGEQCTVRELDAFESLMPDIVHACTEDPPTSETTVTQSHEELTHDSAAHTGKRSQGSIEVKVESPLVSKCIRNNPSILLDSVKELHVTFEVFTKPAKIRITSSNLSKSGWQKDATEKVDACIKTNFTVKRGMRVHKDGMQELLALLSNIKGDSETMLEHEFAQNGRSFDAAGGHSVVGTVEERAYEIFTKYEQTTVDVKLTPQKFVFFSKVKQQQIKESFSRVTFQLNPPNSSLKFHGSVHDTTIIKAQLPEILAYEAVDIALDSLVVSYFMSSNPTGYGELDKLIKSSSTHCQVAPFFRGDGAESSLQLLCDPNESTLVPSIAETICHLTDVKHLPLPESYISVQHTVSEDYDTLCAKLKTQLNNQIIICCSQTHISVAGIAESVHQCAHLLSQFIKEKSSTVLSIELDKGEWRLLSRYMHSKLEAVLSKCQSVEVEVTQPFAVEEVDEEPCIVLKGDRIKVKAMSHEISELREGICKTTIPIERPGTCNFLRSKSTRLAFDGLEIRNNVAIEVTERIEDNAQEMSLGEIELSPQFKRKCVASIKTKQIVIYTGDITEFSKAEVIVNAANGDLKHIGGVAQAISDKGGPTVQQDSDQHVRRKGQLSVGETWLTKQVGNLPCKALVHAVGPIWSGGFRKEEALLGKACHDSLYAAKGYNSIVFPAISSGIYGFPIDKCAETMVSAMVGFCNKNPMCELRDIAIILPPSKSAQVTHFVKALRKILPADSVHADPDTMESEISFPSSHAQHPYKPFTASSRNPEPKRTKSYASAAVPPSMLNLIKLRKGSLLDVKADVYVNTTNNNLDLSQGAVSIALLKAGGQTLQTECNKQSPIQTGDIAVTGPGNLPCSYVLHTVVPSYNGGQGEQVLKHSVQKCLKKCSSLGMKSIAFPAIGTGNLGYPNDAVARTMIKAITDYMSSHKRTSIKAIHLVIFMNSTYQAFQHELQGYNSGGAATSVETRSADFSTSKPKSRRQYRSAPLREDSSVVAGTASHKEPTFTIGTLQVQVLNGDITEEGTDVIVNPTNAFLKLEGQGVAGALLRKGGHELQRLCNTVIANGKPLHGEKVVITSSTGNLKCKYLFHINFEGTDNKQFVKVITNCLNKAEDTKCNSISFPAIGTGTHGYPPQEAAAGMMKAIEQFSSTNPRYVKCIRLVLFQPSAHQEFLAKFRNPAQPGLWQRMWNYAVSSKSTPTWKLAAESVTVPEETPTMYTEEEPEIKELRLMIYGCNNETIKVVEKEIFSLVDENFTTEPVDDPYVDQLSPSEEQTLKKKGKQLQVDVKIDRAPLNRITLKGDKADVHQMKSYLIQCFAKFERSASQKREAEQIYTTIKWKRMDSNDGDYFDAEANYEIEMASQKGQTTYTHHDDAQHFTIDFSKLQVTDHNDGNSVQKLERCDLIKELLQGERPKTWEAMPIDPNTSVEVAFHIVDLKPTDEEYLKANKLFDQTMTRMVTNQPVNPSAVMGQSFSTSVGRVSSSYTMYSSNTYTSIVSIQRIQNPLLYTQYIARKKEADKRMPSGSQTSERRLFHGTAQGTCQNINQDGFNRSYSGKNATVYGKGVYFARDASYSARDQYSPPGVTNGYKYIYVARVITGEFTLGDRSMIDAPAKADGTKYDSVVDNVQNPQVFVVFQDAVVYPEYLITFK